MDVGALKNFLVEFTPNCESKMVAELRVTVVNNPFEDNVIQLVGEGYKENVTIDNIHYHDNGVMTTQQLRAKSAIEFDGDEVISELNETSITLKLCNSLKLSASFVFLDTIRCLVLYIISKNDLRSN